MDRKVLPEGKLVCNLFASSSCHRRRVIGVGLPLRVWFSSAFLCLLNLFSQHSPRMRDQEQDQSPAHAAQQGVIIVFASRMIEDLSEYIKLGHAVNSQVGNSMHRRRRRIYLFLAGRPRRPQLK
jgi:hypothetical protein